MHRIIFPVSSSFCSPASKRTFGGGQFPDNSRSSAIIPGTLHGNSVQAAIILRLSIVPDPAAIP